MNGAVASSGSNNDSASVNERCPRCGGGFHCGVNDAAPCACGTFKLSATLLARLRAEYPSNCLCMACLAELARAETAEAAR